VNYVIRRHACHPDSHLWRWDESSTRCTEYHVVFCHECFPTDDVVIPRHERGVGPNLGLERSGAWPRFRVSRIASGPRNRHQSRRMARGARTTAHRPRRQQLGDSLRPDRGLKGCTFGFSIREHVRDRRVFRPLAPVPTAGGCRTSSPPRKGVGPQSS